MRRDPDFWLIMTLVTLIVLCGMLLACHAEAARGCLTREQATRTWPAKQLGIDADGCFTYLRSGVRAAPDMLTVDQAATAAVEAAVALDILQRWPTVVEVEMRRPEFLPPPEPEPLVTAKNVWAAIFSVVLFCAVLEVLFGGYFWPKMGPKGPRRGMPGP